MASGVARQGNKHEQIEADSGAAERKPGCKIANAPGREGTRCA